MTEGTPLESLPEILGRQPLSTRTLGILATENIHTMEHLADVHPVYLVRLPGVGKRAYREIALARLLWRMHTRTPKAVTVIEDCECVGYTIRTDYGTGIEHDVDRSSCLIHGGEPDGPQPR